MEALGCKNSQELREVIQDIIHEENEEENYISPSILQELDKSFEMETQNEEISSSLAERLFEPFFLEENTETVNYDNGEAEISASLAERLLEPFDSQPVQVNEITSEKVQLTHVCEDISSDEEYFSCSESSNLWDSDESIVSIHFLYSFSKQTNRIIAKKRHICHKIIFSFSLKNVMMSLFLTRITMNHHHFGFQIYQVVDIIVL